MAVAKTWSPGWYPVISDPTLQREWNGQQWTGVTRPTKHFLGIVVGGDPKKASIAAEQFHTQLMRLQAAQSAGSRGEARVAWTTAYTLLDEAFGPDGPGMWNSALTSINFDPTVVQSALLSSIPSLEGSPFEVYEDFVVCNGRALDNSRFTTLSLFQDGQIQVTVTNVADKKGRTRAVRQVHDMRTAAIQASGPNGALRANIHPDLTGQAQQLVAHFNARMQALTPSAVTAGDLQAMFDSILNSTGQPAAEKLKQLDKLRYDRLLSDEDWSRAKERILGNV